MEEAYLNRELSEFIVQELLHHSRGCKATLDSRHTIPATKKQLGTYNEMSASLEGGSTQFRDWRRDHAPSLWTYGIDFVQRYLEAQLTASPGSVETAFRHAALANFHPHGSHFDCYIVRLFPQPGPGDQHPPSQADGKAPACVGAAHRYAERFELRPAIYGHDEQLHIVDTLFRLYEDYFLSLVARFGTDFASDALPSCWDMLRRDVGDWIPQFRPALLRHEKEWLASALLAPV